MFLESKRHDDGSGSHMTLPELPNDNPSIST